MVELFEISFHARQNYNGDDGQHENEKGGQHVDDVPNAAEVVASPLVEECPHVHEDEEGEGGYEHGYRHDYFCMMNRNWSFRQNYYLQ